MSKSVAKERPIKRGLSQRAERVFNISSFIFVITLGAAWAYSVGEARAAGDKVNVVGPVMADSRANALEKTKASTTDSISDPTNIAALHTMPKSAIGESGKLRAWIEAGERPGIVKAAIAIANTVKPLLVDFHIITPRPASDKQRGRIGSYFLGNWPAPKKAKNGAVEYTPPSGFIEVTKENQETPLSEHFRLRDFLTKDQTRVWPKYLVVNLKLIDKLELILDDLRERGIKPEGVRVMSGFRTPQYNATGGDPRGRASLSRHMYGDAADVFIDNTGNGRMDDLNGDGRVDIKDAKVIAEAAERVERAHPSLVGGIGVYPGTSSHGPFVHIDTRGYPARW
jgi:uncharacterized protein YcbK (DUF882 family)